MKVKNIKTRISNLGYLNRIRDNIFSIKKRKLLPLYEDLKSANCVICGGSGRSLFSLNAAMSQMAMSQISWRNKVILTPDDPGFPGKNMYSASSTLLRINSKVSVASSICERLYSGQEIGLISSGS